MDLISPLPGYRDAPLPAWDPDTPADLADAEEFFHLHRAEMPDAPAPGPRLAAARAEVEATGTYTHTAAELAFGARVAWRNASRCIGRRYWRGLRVLDRRDVFSADGVFDCLVEHLHHTFQSGRIRPMLSVFPASRPGSPAPRVWNEQLIRYADDPRYADFVAGLANWGWHPSGEPFEVLPLIVETAAEGPRLYRLPPEAVREVPLSHPSEPWFAGLGLRWHAVPMLSHLRMVIGGVSYPCAPFNGWYMGTEIGARNLADESRYALLPLVARQLGLDTSEEATLWRDRALVELNVAVLHSFTRHGVRISDHHTESRRFLTHVAREARDGRIVPADWTWIVPPMSGAATPVFHRYYPERVLRPTFVLDREAADLAMYARRAELAVKV
jgi:nitric-oxide synthase, bacterial